MAPRTPSAGHAPPCFGLTGTGLAGTPRRDRDALGTGLAGTPRRLQDSPGPGLARSQRTAPQRAVIRRAMTGRSPTGRHPSGPHRAAPQRAAIPAGTPRASVGSAAHHPQSAHWVWGSRLTDSGQLRRWQACEGWRTPGRGRCQAHCVRLTREAPATTSCTGRMEVAHCRVASKPERCAG